MEFSSEKVRVMIVKVFGQVLREIRTERGISQEKLAEYCEMDRSYMSELERGLKKPSIVTIFKLSKALEINPHDFIKMVENRLNDR